VGVGRKLIVISFLVYLRRNKVGGAKMRRASYEIPAFAGMTNKIRKNTIGVFKIGRVVGLPSWWRLKSP